MNITVYCSSSDGVPSRYIEAATELGRLIGERGHTLVYGGATVGSMGAVARSAAARGGSVIGVMPEKLHAHGLAFDGCDEILITRTMRERKEEMESRGEAFIALPGGLGTMEEILEVMVLKQLGYHRRAIVLVDIDGFYADLMRFFEKLYSEQFMKESTRRQYVVVPDPTEALARIEEYEPPELENKWFSPHTGGSRGV